MCTSRTVVRTAALPSGEIELPGRPHRPGSGSRPDRALLSAVKAGQPTITLAADWKDNRPYRYGWSLFEAGFYWEAHEVWEAVWLAARPNSLERTFLKASIQLTNGYLKQAMGKTGAAQRLFTEVNALHAELAANLGSNSLSFMGVDLQIFVPVANQNISKYEL